MDDRIRLKVLGISYSQIQSGVSALILAQEGGPIRIPVVIGAGEAQSIAIKMEGIVTPRPLTHDLFMSFAHAFGIKLIEVFIYRFEDGVFSSEMTFTDGERTVEIDARTSDAIAIAMRTNAPIYTTRAIMEETGFVMEQSDEQGSDEPESSASSNDTNDQPKLENYTIEELERTLQRMIDNEQYEEAARVQQIIDHKKSQI